MIPRIHRLSQVMPDPAFKIQNLKSPMKSKTNPYLRFVLLTAATLSFGFVATAQATTYTWGGGNGNWSAINWLPGPVTGVFVALVVVS